MLRDLFPRPICLLSPRWACLKSTQRSQSLFPLRQNPSFSPALSRTPTNVRQPGTCSKICSCVKTSKAKRTRSHSNPQVTSATQSNTLSAAAIIMTRVDPSAHIHGVHGSSGPVCAHRTFSLRQPRRAVKPPHNTTFLHLAAVWNTCDRSELLSAGRRDRTYTSDVENIGWLDRGGIWEKSSLRKISKAKVCFTFTHGFRPAAHPGIPQSTDSFS